MKWTKNEPTKSGYYWRVNTNDPSDIEVVFVTFITAKNAWTQKDETIMEVKSKNIFISVTPLGDKDDIYWSDEEVPFPDMDGLKI